MKRFFFFSRSTILTAAAVLAVALAIAAPVGAAPIHFDNPAGPGHFDWRPALNDDAFLNITQSAAEQLNVSAPNTLQHLWAAGASQVVFFDNSVATGGLSDLFVLGFDAGTIIDGNLNWVQDGFVNADGVGSEIDEGVSRFIGFQFDPGDGQHFGWIEVVRTGFTLDAFAWGYETEPGVPIAAGAPEPGTLSLLALAGAALLRRRRRCGGK